MAAAELKLSYGGVKRLIMAASINPRISVENISHGSTGSSGTRRLLPAGELYFCIDDLNRDVSGLKEEKKREEKLEYRVKLMTFKGT